MWSGPTRVLAAVAARRRRGRSSRSSRCPRSPAPIATSIRARSWTCGSQAALPIDGRARRQRRGQQRVLGAHHRRLVHEDLAGPQAAVAAAKIVMSRSTSCSAPRQANASRCGSSRRRPITSPPGRRQHGPAEAGQQRPGEQERRADPRGSGRDRPRRRGRRRRRTARPRSRRATRRVTPRCSSSATIASTSAIRGTLRDDHLVGRQQAGGQDRQRGVLVAGGRDGAGRAARRLR